MIRHLLSYMLRNYLVGLPDKIYLRLLFIIETGKILHLKSPRTFQEKIQWLKLYNRQPEYTQMVDKVAVKKYISSIIGDQFVIPTIATWQRFDEIDFRQLPEQFVLKTSHGGGSCGVVICRDKSTFDMKRAQYILEKSLKSDIYRSYREWPYKNVPRCILAEKYMVNGNDSELTDYKFFCFNGRPLYCQVIRNRHTHETIDFYDMEWRHQEFVGLNPVARNALLPIAKPLNWETMISICHKLSYNIPFVRVDMYEIMNAVYFGELTFFPASGLGTFSPYNWNLYMGDLLNCPTECKTE